MRSMSFKVLVTLAELAERREQSRVPSETAPKSVVPLA